ncbi:S9 family peptidase [Shewanella violacea]|uniref:Prolyl oligopeptidase family protein n=1 Tax=Shewanella violacea (strain JCM 10179 / CIP 106290 / LMG 19151 / DSS12) TaxID=637905 RepID=D4ZCX4_SHEVD|nr:S9 family peptidase [Shewanella violacea]BAJ03869.1 prolyl oligopeptidase family protein [Shewanella violacea DSS12]
MKKSLHLSVLALAVSLGLVACSNTSTDRTPTPADKLQITQQAGQQYDAQTFFETTTYFGSSFSENGESILIGSDQSGIFNLYKLDAATGAQSPLTTFKDTTYPVSWFPNDDRVLLTQDNAGNELYHLFVRELDGKITDITPGDETRAGFVNFTNDGKYFYAMTNERDAKFMDLYRYDAKTYERELVFKNELGFNISEVSKDGRFVSLSKTHTNRDSDTYLLDFNKRIVKPTIISKHSEPANYNPMTFSADGSALYYSTDAKGEFSQVWKYDIATGEHSLAVKDDWNVSFVYFSESGRYRVSGVNADASTKISILDTKTGKALKLPQLPDGDLRNVNFSKDEQTLAFYINSDTSPSNLFVWQLGTDSVKQLTQALNPKINPDDLVASEVVRFKSFDGLDIPGLLFKPKGASADNKRPAVVFVHGGPGGQSRTGYSAMRQHLINHGYAVFAVNNRGSSGYGKTFFHLDDKNHGENDLQDIVYGKNYLQTLDWIDKDKIGIMGGSYGGYMTAAALAFEPDEFKVGIDIFGVTNWVRTLESIPPWWESFKKALYDEMGDPATDAERHRAISPLFHAQNITKPLMVIQGANDPRVLKIESDELVEKVKQNGVPVEYVVFDDEGHGFSKKHNRVTASEAYVKFLDTYLKGAGLKVPGERVATK